MSKKAVLMVSVKGVELIIRGLTQKLETPEQIEAAKKMAEAIMNDMMDAFVEDLIGDLLGSIRRHPEPPPGEHDPDCPNHPDNKRGGH